MGRGLSDLQWYILRRAGQQDRVYHREVLAGYYGWKLQITRWGDSCDLRDRGLGEKVFSPAEIGRARYHSARSALSHACARLSDRGLVTRIGGTYAHWSGVVITDAGRALLSVDAETESTESSTSQLIADVANG